MPSPRVKMKIGVPSGNPNASRKSWKAELVLEFLLRSPMAWYTKEVDEHIGMLQQARWLGCVWEEDGTPE